MDRHFLVAVDAYSKWPEVIELHHITTEVTINELRRLFSLYGIPRQLASDNGTQFTSTNFQTFVKANAIKHIRGAPYHPATNGQAERFIQTLKKVIKAGENSTLTVKHRVLNFLLTYRTTPHSTTGQTPAELFLKRSLRTRLDILHPDVKE